MADAYSTGPLENAVGLGSQTTTGSKTVWTKVLNNRQCGTIMAAIRVFRLDGMKMLIDTADLTVGPTASAFHVSDVSMAAQFEVEIAISPRRAADQVLLGVFGKDENGDLNPSHRLVQEELTPIDDLVFSDGGVPAPIRQEATRRVIGRAMT